MNGLSFDEVLQYTGEFGKFQILLEAAVCIMIFPPAMLILIPYFGQQIPPWQCSRNSTICTYSGAFSPQDQLYKSRCRMSRSEWEFSKPKEYSIITQFDLYCDTEIYVQLAASLPFFSMAIGSVIQGWMSDRFGRKKTLLPSMIGIIVIGFASAFSPNLTFYIIARLLVGFFIPGVIVQIFVLISEYVGPKWRPFAGMTLWFAFALSGIVLGVIAYFVQAWKILMVATTAPYSVCLLFFKFIPESIRWLQVNGKTNEAMNIVQSIAKINSKQLPDIKLKKLKKNTPTGLQHYKNLFKPQKIAIRSLIQGYAWIVNGLVFYGVTFAASDLGGNMYRDYILLIVVDFPAAVLAIYICNRVGRRKAVIIPMLISGIACIAVSFIPPNTQRRGLVGFRVFLGMVGKFCITMAFDSIYTWSAELYPTVIRGAGMGFLQIACRSGSGLAPWATKWLSVVDVVLPFSVMGSSAVIGSLLLYWLPETAHMETNEMLHDQFSENTNDQFSYRQVDEDGERTLMIKSDRTVVYTKEKWFLVKKYDTGYIA